jgi:hypothetical protein
VTLSAPATSTVSVTVSLAPGTASSGTDYKPLAPKVVTFSAGQFQKTISVSVIEDHAREGNETARFTLTNPTTGLSLGRSTGTLTIVDDD